MAPKDFEVGQLVWAKMKYCPMWPARIAEPKEPKSPSTKNTRHFVYFFGTHNNAWILDKDITPHSEEMLQKTKKYKRMPIELQIAIQEIQENKALPPQSKTLKRPASKPMSTLKEAAKKRKIEASSDIQEEETPSSEVPGIQQDQPHSNGDEKQMNPSNSKETPSAAVDCTHPIISSHSISDSPISATENVANANNNMGFMGFRMARNIFNYFKCKVLA